jgi:hypothetical protein
MATKRAHSGIYCDECGAYPIKGTRFKSLRIYDYDICCDCRYYNYAADCADFTAYNSPVSKFEANQVGPAVINRIDAQSASDAEEQLRKGRDAHVAFFGFFGQRLDGGDRDDVVNFINRNVFLTNIHIRLHAFENYKEVFTAITRGLLKNQTVKHLCWHLSPQHDQDSFLDASPLQELIERNGALEALFITRSKYWPGSIIKESTPELENDFASKLFGSLKKNKALRSFRLETVTRLSQSTKELAWKSIECNTSITRFHANFITKDSHIDMLLSFNQSRWMNRWTDEYATPLSRVEVIKEIKDSNLHNEVAALYHLVRNFPEALNACKK